MTKENKKETTDKKIKATKTLGGSSYKNSKQKKKIQKQKDAQEKILVTKDRQLKVKIKHLEKELERIARGNEDKKSAAEKSALEQKLSKLTKIADQKVKDKK